jgi:hypothetical protein
MIGFLGSRSRRNDDVPGLSQKSMGIFQIAFWYGRIVQLFRTSILGTNVSVDLIATQDLRRFNKAVDLPAILLGTGQKSVQQQFDG